MDVESLVKGLAGFGAGWVLWTLVGMSLFGGAVASERLLYLWVTRADGERLRLRLRTELEADRPAAALAMLSESGSHEARVAAAGVGAQDGASAEQRMAAEAQLSKLELEARLAWLGTLGANAPFVGLLGTVIGIVRAFRELAIAGGQPSAALFAEIGEALIATAVGLLVALPAVAAFNLLMRAARVRVARAEALSRDVLAWHAARAFGAEAARQSQSRESESTPPAGELIGSRRAVSYAEGA